MRLVGEHDELYTTDIIVGAKEGHWSTISRRDDARFLRVRDYILDTFVSFMVPSRAHIYPTLSEFWLKDETPIVMGYHVKGTDLNIYCLAVNS